MPNGLTGDFDAVAQVHVEVVNRILGTLHQNGAKNNKDDGPSLPHSFAVRVGDPPKSPQFQLSKAVLDAVDAILGTGKQGSSGKPGVPPVSAESPQDVTTAAQAAAEAAAQAAGLEDFDFTLLLVVRGTAQGQISAPTVSLPQGSTSEVTVHCQVRARYQRDPGTLPLPEPIHGEVRATFTVEQQPWSNDGKNILELKVTDDDSKITFLPAAGTGLSAAEANQIAHHVRVLLRRAFEPTNQELPEGFAFAQFKGLGSGNSQVLALPVNLSGPGPMVGSIDSVTNAILKSGDHFGIAISKEFVNSLLQPAIDKLKAFKLTYKIKGWFDITLATYHVSVSSVTVAWQSGQILLTVQGSATTGAWGWPDYTFQVQQALKLAFDASTQSISLQAVGDPNVSGSLPGFAQNLARPKIIQQRDAAISQAQGTVQQALSGSGALDNGLKAFDPYAKATLTAVEIQADGVVMRGTVHVSGRLDAVADFVETPDGSGYTALKSWIPAGTLENFYWTWIIEGATPHIPWTNEQGSKFEEHRFILPRPRSLPQGGQVCLGIGGKQTNALGPAIVPKEADTGDSCTVEQPDWVWAMPSWWDTIMGPIWGPDPGPEGVVEDAIVAHVGVPAESGKAMGPNAVVQFAGNPSASLSALSEALAMTSRRDAPVSVVLVLPRGSFRQPGAVLQEKLGTFSAAPTISFAITEDYEEAWSKALGAAGGPATFLLNAEGELVWQQAGPLEAGGLRAALDEYLLPGERPRARLLRTAVRTGDRAPDFLFEYAEGRQLALRKLRGQRVVLSFWKSWSAPCVRELRHLQALHERAEGDGTVILAIGDGEDRLSVRQLGEEHGLRFTLVPDPERKIARRYGVSCWPTTVRIDETGRVAGLHFGATPRPDRRRAAASRQEDARAKAVRAD